MFDQQGLVSLSDVQANVDKPSENQHVFVEIHFSKPTFCDLPSCQGFIWGLTKQGFSCSACHYATHKRCMTMAMESELCPGVKIKHLKNVNKMPLKKKLKRVNAYLERLVPFAPIPNNIEFEHFLQISISDFSSINSAIPNLFESFKNTNISRENIASMLTTLAANESAAYFIISLLHIFAGDENNRDIIVKCGAVEVVLSRMMPEEGISPYTILSPSLSFLDELMKNGHSVADILLHVSTSPIEAAALLDKTNVGGSLEFIARKRNAVAVQNFLNSFVALAKTDYVAKDDLLQTKIARILASVYRDEKAKQYVERCGGHELVVRAATRQLVNLHNEITDAEVRFDYDGLLYDSPLCRVYRGTYSKQRVAIKVFSRDSLGFDQLGFNKEIALMNIIQSENAVKCYGVNTKGENPFVVMEFFTNGSLNDFVTLNPFEIPIRTKVYLMIGAAKGIRFLHEKSIIHRDIKTQNFMVGDEFLNCKVIDFGVSRVDTQNAKKTIIGTPVYMAPEIMHDKPYTFSADSYSFGLVMWEMIAKKIPYFDIHPMRVAEHILKNRPTIPEDCDPLLASTMTACWDPEPASRPLFDQIIDLLCQFSFPLGVKRPDHPDSDVVTFANLYTVLDAPTYKRIFAELDAKTCAALREVCKLYKDVVDSNFKKNGVEQINIKGEQ